MSSLRIWLFPVIFCRILLINCFAIAPGAIWNSTPQNKVVSCSLTWKQMQRWKFRLLTAQSCLRRGVVMMDTEDHHLQKDIERYTFCCHFFFQTYVSRVKSLALNGFKGSIVNFHRFQEFQDALLSSSGIFVSVILYWIRAPRRCLPT